MEHFSELIFNPEMVGTLCKVEVGGKSGCILASRKADFEGQSEYRR